MGAVRAPAYSQGHLYLMARQHVGLDQRMTPCSWGTLFRGKCTPRRIPRTIKVHVRLATD
ncbi:hypothetical protein IG631_07646 [Alternaria alternata]|nr:hypothetical protein IG631_07646 [Alternaria alternata]